MADYRSIICQRNTGSAVIGAASASTALADNSARAAFSIQNVGTNPLFVALGAGCSSTKYHVVLKAGTGAADGIGGSFAMENGVVYTGIVTIAGTNPQYVVLEL